MDSPANPDYFRSLSSESGSYVMVPNGGRREATPRGWVALVVAVIVVLQVASTAGLFVYLNMSVSEVKNQGVSEELRCLGLLNALDKNENVPEHLVPLFGEPCIKLAEAIKAYISKVTENIILKHAFPEPRIQPRVQPARRPSAHLTLREMNPHGSMAAFQAPQADLHQSCRHPLRSWGDQSFGSHMYNMSLVNGRLRVSRSGRYYVYSQVYFRYLSPVEGDQHSASHQLVQCVYKKTSYAQPIQLLKGVGTKCWAPEAEYALHSIHQGGLFELRAGDELFVSVSSPTIVHAEDSSSYFGAFQLDL